MQEVGRHHYDRWPELGSNRRLKVREDKMMKMGARKQGCGSVNLPARFPPPLSTLAVYGKTSCAALGACTPRAIYRVTNKGPRAQQSASVGQPIKNPRKRGAPQMLCTARGSRIGLRTMEVIASAPMMPTAP
jgi:hypothetical protein